MVVRQLKEWGHPKHIEGNKNALNKRTKGDVLNKLKEVDALNKPKEGGCPKQTDSRGMP